MGVEGRSPKSSPRPARSRWRRARAVSAAGDGEPDRLGQLHGAAPARGRPIRVRRALRLPTGVRLVVGCVPPHVDPDDLPGPRQSRVQQRIGACSPKHDAAGYFSHFSAAAYLGDPSLSGSTSRGYNSFDIAVGGTSWHLIALNAECRYVSPGVSGGCASGSPQEQWLAATLHLTRTRARSRTGINGCGATRTTPTTRRTDRSGTTSTPMERNSC
jgi:hypothetical protein